jgi:hypothetical protein
MAVGYGRYGGYAIVYGILSIFLISSPRFVTTRSPPRSLAVGPKVFNCQYIRF